jgi:hypothetical protein
MPGMRVVLIGLALVAAPSLDARAQGDIGIKPGDTVNVATGQGFVLAIVKQRDGHVFNVHVINGPEVLKRYPAELRRRGKSTDYDHANGIYDNEDRIQVRYEGKWIDSHVIQSMGMEYQVALPGNMAAWAKPDQMKYVGPPPEKVVAKAGQPPKPGLVSCAGKVEGRYAAEGGMPMQLTFRSGKVTISIAGESQTGECWFGDGKVYVSVPGEERAMELDLNDDGSLQGPFGELKKKAK